MPQSIKPLIISTFSPISPGEGVRLDLAQSIVQECCVWTDKLAQRLQEHCLQLFPRVLAIYFTSVTAELRHLLNFTWCCHRMPLKSTMFSANLKRLAKEDALQLAPRVVPACVGFLGDKLSLYWAIKIHLDTRPAKEFSESSASHYQVWMFQISFEWDVENILPTMICPLWNMCN